MNRNPQHHSKAGPKAGPNGGPQRRRPGDRARRLLQMLAQGHSVDDVARQLKRPRLQLEKHIRALFAHLRATTAGAALATLEASPAAAAAVEALEPDDTSAVDDTVDSADGTDASANASTDGDVAAQPASDEAPAS